MLAEHQPQRRNLNREGTLMWTRDLLKTNAKAALTGHYWLALVVSLLAGMLGGGTSGAGGFSGLGWRGNLSGKADGFDSFKEFFAQKSDIWFPVVFFVSIIVVLAVIGGGLFQIFFGNPVGVGHNRFYLENRYGKGEIGHLFRAFRPGYMNIVKVLFIKNLYIFLWSLLLIVPGIVKYYEYIAVDYILAENPGIDYRRALELSRQMTDGKKWDIFVLQLSFIGWQLLCLMTCGIGFLFLNPYMQTTFAEMYCALRDSAFEVNVTGPQELPGVTG